MLPWPRERIWTGILLLVITLTLTEPVHGQAEDRIWGRVTTTDGEIHEGFIRWDRNEGSWVDLLDGSKEVVAVNYAVWLAANERGRATRSVDVFGYRVSWDEEDPDFRSFVAAAVRFGHMESLIVDGPDSVTIHLRSGERLALSGGASDIGRSIRDIVIDRPQGREIELGWSDLTRVDFSAAPVSALPGSPRLYGTVEDVHGVAHTGFIAWDLDEILESDVLDGEEIRGGEERDIRFADIRSIERIDRGSRVELYDGQRVELTGSNDVHRGHGGVQISDPALGMIEVEWRDFRSIRFHRPVDGESFAGYETFDGGRPLAGSVETVDGERLDGVIRWDADEASTWEILDGEADGIRFSIELGMVQRIERDSTFGALVTLLDGRTFHLDDDNDVNWDNKGAMVAPEGARLESVGSWRLVPWDELKAITFRGPVGVGAGR